MSIWGLVIAWAMSLLEPDLKRAVREFYSPLRGSDSTPAWLEEVPLFRGLVRADLVSVPDLHCFEIKSERDRLDRLIGQGVVYSAVFNRVTLVLTPRHLVEATALIPDWWGLLVHGEDGLAWQRRPLLNRSPDPGALSSLLSREEAFALLSTTKAVVTKRAPLYALHEAVAGHVSVSKLRSHLKSVLSARVRDTAPWLPA